MDTSSSQGVFGSPVILNISPGLIDFENLEGNGETRFLTSAIVDWNLSKTMAAVQTPITYGLESGLLFSHLGASGSNFFGAADEVTTTGGGNLFIIPLNLWGGYNWNERGFVGLHTGADLYLQSNAASMSLGRTDEDGGGAANFLPNVGAKVGYTVGQNVAITLRTNWSFAPADTIFVGVIGATIPLS